MAVQQLVGDNTKNHKRFSDHGTLRPSRVVLRRAIWRSHLNNLKWQRGLLKNLKNTLSGGSGIAAGTLSTLNGWVLAPGARNS